MFGSWKELLTLPRAVAKRLQPASAGRPRAALLVASDNAMYQIRCRIIDKSTCLDFSVQATIKLPIRKGRVEDKEDKTQDRLCWLFLQTYSSSRPQDAPHQRQHSSFEGLPTPEEA